MDLIQDATLGLNSHLTKEERKKKKENLCIKFLGEMQQRNSPVSGTLQCSLRN